MSEEQQHTEQPIETQDGTEEQAKPAVETDGTSAEDKKSTNTKSQVFVNSELKGKLGDLKKKRKLIPMTVLFKCFMIHTRKRIILLMKKLNH